ncbi:acyl carrier protein [Alsobacter sp. R-9]
MTANIETTVRTFIAENLLFKGDASSLGTDTSLIEAGIIDSTAVLELVSFLESEFGISVADADIVPENLDSIGSIARYVASRMDAKAA